MINLIGITFGMNYIHQHKIILRDLTFSSILLDYNLYPRIANFDTNVLDNEKFVKLPPLRFFAPEIIHDEQYSFPADVCELFYHVFSNDVPAIKHNGEANFHYRISNGELPALNEKMPTRFHSFIKSMWNTNPNQRPTFEQIIEKFLHSMRKCCIHLH